MKNKHVQYRGVTGRGGLALIPVMASVLMLAACAGNPSGGVASAEEDCVYVRVTGSNLPVKDCRPRGEREALAAQQQEAAQNSARDIQLLDEAGDRSLGADSLGF